MRIAYVTSHNPHSRWSWSGTAYFMFHALQRLYPDTVHISPRPKERFGRLRKKLRFGSKDRTDDASILDAAHDNAERISKQLNRSRFDLIVAPVASTEIAFLETPLPIVYISDATAAIMRGYYGISSNSTQDDERDECERQALHKASVAVFSSQWAANSATNDYGVSSEKVRVVPFGANIDHVPPWEGIQRHRQMDACRLFFLGKDWVRKGGDIALDVYKQLKARGMPVELRLCGTEVPEGTDLAGAIVVGKLNKDKPREYRKLVDIFLQSHFMLVPSRADCTPIVFSEANAFGLPVISTRTGGISSVVRDGENGFLFPVNAQPEALVAVIEKVFRERSRYVKIAQGARNEYDTRLNWNAWAASVEAYLRTM